MPRGGWIGLNKWFEVAELYSVSNAQAVVHTHVEKVKANDGNVLYWGKLYCWAILCISSLYSEYILIIFNSHLTQNTSPRMLFLLFMSMPPTSPYPTNKENQINKQRWIDNRM
jgi:hypothetical protein